MAKFDSLRVNSPYWGTVKARKSSAPVTAGEDARGRKTFTSGGYTATSTGGDKAGNHTRVNVTNKMDKGPGITASKRHTGRWVVPESSSKEVGRNEHFHAAVNAAHDSQKVVRKQDKWF